MFLATPTRCVIWFLLSLPIVAAQTEGWRRIQTAHTPGPRNFGAMAYDPVRQVIVLFGGASNLADTWIYDGRDWTEVFPATVPTGRDQHEMAFDPVSQRVLMHGGHGYNVWLDDTWVWSGTDWVMLHTGGDSHPTGAMAFDPVRRQMLRFGGSPPSSETRAWNGAQWLLLNVAAPLPRERVAMTTDTRRNRIVLCGGYGPGGGFGSRFQDTWEWDGSAWSMMTPASLPPYVSAHSMVFDSDRGWVLLMGGEIPQVSGPILSRDLYAFDGSTWAARNLALRPPSGLRVPFAYDSDRRRSVYLTRGETWEYTSPPSASFREFGQGCNGTLGVPTLVPGPGQLPWVGGSFAVDVRNVPLPFAAGLIGVSRSDWLGVPLPLDLGASGMPGCTLNVSADVFVPLLATAGVATWIVAIPGDPALIGSLAYQQALLPDPGANRLGATTSNAGELQLGGR